MTIWVYSSRGDTDMFLGVKEFKSIIRSLGLKAVYCWALSDDHQSRGMGFWTPYEDGSTKTIVGSWT